MYRSLSSLVPSAADPLALQVEELAGVLQRVTPDQFISEGRVYGGGLHKVEPKERA